MFFVIFLPVTYVGLKRSMPYNPLPFHQMAMYEPANTRQNVPLEDYTKVCAERDMWATRYQELK